MKKRYEIDMLTTDSVSIKTQNYTNIDGVDYDLGLPHRKAYINSTKGRAELTAEIPEPYLSAVMVMWGDTPTIEDISEKQ